MSRAIAAVLGLALVSALSLVSASISAPSLASSGDNAETLLASADAFVRAGDPNANQGARSYLRISTTGNNRALVRFDQSQLVAVIGTGKLVSATLKLDVLQSSGWRRAGRTISVHRLLSDWIEGNGSNTRGKGMSFRRGAGPGATWNCAIDSNIANHRKDCSGATEWEMGKLNQRSGSTHPWVDAATATATIRPNQSGSLSFDVTADVVAFFSHEAANSGWIVKTDVGSRPGRVRFSSRETGSGPKLVVVVQASDTEAPEVEPVGLSVQDPIGDYVNGQDVYSVDFSATDGDTGVARVAVGLVGGTELATSDADCSNSCPADYSETLSIDSSEFDEGAYQLAASATDGAGNTGTSEPWTMWVDRTVPEPVTNLRITRFDEYSATTTIGWNTGVDPQLVNGSPGSGVQSYEYRYRVGDGDWTDVFWTDIPEFDLPDSSLGDVVDVEVREADEVGNTSSYASATLTVFAASESTPWYSDMTPDPSSVVTLTENQSSEATDIALSDPRIAPLLTGLNASVTDVVPRSTQGTQDTVFGADVTISWNDPVTLETTWPVVVFSEDSDSYSVDQVHYRSTDTTSVDVIVTFDPTSVVGFQPLDGFVDESSVDYVARGVSVSPRVSSLLPASVATNRASAQARVPNWVHAVTPKKISGTYWFWWTHGDSFWNYDFDSSHIDLTNKAAAQRHADWPVAVIFTNQATLSIVKGTIWGGHLKSPMYMKLYDRGSDPSGSATMNRTVWDKDSGNYLGNACVGTKWHYRLYGPDTDMGGDGSFYNTELGYYVVATAHKDYHDQKGADRICPKDSWSGDTELAEKKLANAADGFRSPLLPLRYYKVNNYTFYLWNEDNRGNVKNRHYRNNGFATDVCVKIGEGYDQDTCSEHNGEYTN